MNGKTPRLIKFSYSWLLIGFVIGCQNQPSPPAGRAESDASPQSSAAIVPPEETTPFVLEPDFVLLTRDDFEAFGAEPETWSATADGITCSGKPRGYLYSKLPYSNFTLRLDFRFPRPAKLTDDSKFKGNTGFLVYINGDHKLWPVCIEVQGKYVQIGAIRENGGADPVVADDNETARQQARKPVGHWNSLDVTSKDGALTVKLNGTLLATSQPGKLVSGLIGIQAEDHPFDVRRMRIRTD